MVFTETSKLQQARHLEKGLRVKGGAKKAQEKIGSVYSTNQESQASARD